ncbi:hypothetical protein ACI2UK_13885 [Ralstonia nicotianae]|uniref:hypothetical protein n=1 Tax=Ralstonia pseudosolanacearum TaxID=1310165 RepID=UPI00200629B3|nr:hypothetical protein [Ralstonia pseudosolanacearum]MCK4118366.1 hypothetical protein [Ralstonia pseudosolanacearum]
MYNAVIEQYKQAQVQAFEAYLKAARFEKECFPSLDPLCCAVRIPKESELRRELESFCMRLASGAVETVRNNLLRPEATHLDVARELKIAGVDVQAALAVGEIPDLDTFWRSLKSRFNIRAEALQ